MLIRGQEIMLPTSMVGNYPNPRWWDAYSTRYWTGDQRPPDSLGREALATATAQQHSSSASRRLHMKLLWIPHQDWLGLDGQRERCLLDSWPDSGDELHILTWQPARGFGRPLSSFGWSTFRQGCTTVHSRPRIPNVMSRYVMGRFA